jgi:hypothetical protein
MNVVLAVPAFSQSTNSSSWAEAPAPADGNRTRTGVARLLYTDVGSRASIALPPNLIVPPLFRDVVDTMIRTSPTFRRQCVRIANAPRMTVVLDWFQPKDFERIRARTMLSTAPDGSRSATVLIRPVDDPVELIAHELEHVLEQLDDIDLSARAAVPASGVRGCGCRENTFETIRAVRAGQAAAAEVRRHGT